LRSVAGFSRLVCSAHSRHSATASANVASRLGCASTSARSSRRSGRPSPALPPGGRDNRRARGRDAAASRRRRQAPPTPAPAAGSTAGRSSPATWRSRRRSRSPTPYPPGTRSRRLAFLASRTPILSGATTGATTLYRFMASECPVTTGYPQYSSQLKVQKRDCHAEGRGFESLQPLSKKPSKSEGFLLTRCGFPSQRAIGHQHWASDTMSDLGTSRDRLAATFCTVDVALLQVLVRRCPRRSQRRVSERLANTAAAHARRDWIPADSSPPKPSP
jgi:hypothetical protein